VVASSSAEKPGDVMAVMRTIIVGAVLAASLTGPAFAQKGTKPDDTPMQMEEQQKRRDATDIDRQYKSTLQRTRGGGTVATPATDDPWSNMRGSGDSKPKR
jgi:hypothetical protein